MQGHAALPTGRTVKAVNGSCAPTSRLSRPLTPVLGRANLGAFPTLDRPGWLEARYDVSAVPARESSTRNLPGVHRGAHM